MKLTLYLLLVGLGTLLLLYSAQPLLLMGQEWRYGKLVKHEFIMDPISVNFMELNRVEILGRGAPIPVTNITVKNYLFYGREYELIKSLGDYNRIIQQSNLSPIKYARDYAWEGNTIRVEDEFQPGNYDEYSRDNSNINIKINQKDWTITSSVEVRPNFLDDNRYHGYFGILAVKEKGIEKIIILQRVSGIHVINKEHLAWRILTIEKNGQVQEERFTYNERGELPQRVNFINVTHTSTEPLGYQSEILQAWPSFFFPLIYPFGTAALGAIFVLIGMISLCMSFLRHRKL